MAHFIGKLVGSRGEASRLGTKDSGVSATLSGWHSGVEVEMWYDEDLEEDVITIRLTNGSSDASSETVIDLGDFCQCHIRSLLKSGMAEELAMVDDKLAAIETIRSMPHTKGGDNSDD